MRDRVQGSVSGLLALLGIAADPLRSREHILLSNILDGVDDVATTRLDVPEREFSFELWLRTDTADQNVMLVAAGDLARSRWLGGDRYSIDPRPHQPGDVFGIEATLDRRPGDHHAGCRQQ